MLIFFRHYIHTVNNMKKIEVCYGGLRGRATGK